MTTIEEINFITELNNFLHEKATEIPSKPLDEQLSFIINAISFLRKYFSTQKCQFEYLFGQLNIVPLFVIRKLLRDISYCVIYLPQEIQKKYSKAIAAPFSFSEFLKFLFVLVPSNVGHSLYLNNPRNLEELPTLAREYLDTELIIDEALLPIVQNDIPSLFLLFSMISRAEKGDERVENQIANMPPLKLIAITTVTHRVRDTKALINMLQQADLFQLDSTTDKKKVQSKKSKKQKKNKPEKQKTVRRVDLVTMESKFAAMKRLELISKEVSSLSPNTKQLDPNIDWNCFEIAKAMNSVHSKICKEKINNLLNDEELYLKIFRDDVYTFYVILTNIVINRYRILPLEQNYTKFFNDLMEYEKQVFINTANGDQIVDNNGDNSFRFLETMRTLYHDEYLNIKENIGKSEDQLNEVEKLDVLLSSFNEIKSFIGDDSPIDFSFLLIKNKEENEKAREREKKRRDLRFDIEKKKIISLFEKRIQNSEFVLAFSYHLRLIANLLLDFIPKFTFNISKITKEIVPNLIGYLKSACESLNLDKPVLEIFSTIHVLYLPALVHLQQNYDQYKEQNIEQNNNNDFVSENIIMIENKQNNNDSSDMNSNCGFELSTGP